jgi:hypothetical protein
MLLTSSIEKGAAKSNLSFMFRIINKSEQPNFVEEKSRLRYTTMFEDLPNLISCPTNNLEWERQKRQFLKVKTPS